MQRKYAYADTESQMYLELWKKTLEIAAMFPINASVELSALNR